MSARPPRPVRVIGLGCQRGCPAEVLMGLVEVTLLEHRMALNEITALASIDTKSTEAGLLELAEHLSLPLHFFDAGQLAAYESRLSHRSQVSFNHTGCYGVAESSALALATHLSHQPAELVIERRHSTRATLAMAVSRARVSPSSSLHA
ncbi:MULTISPECIES: cobalamin biosynthesis protein [unclassified Pseudomonas]|uniref:cobalamin biosynthesis protein n=1 Tax=unclassified Pseudomonas TaxID=196821 RepID=UPI000D37FA0E|nr:MULTISPECIES: cobalamin biosynthesis protein [unclassified Pseudomonas]RAU48064.1 cobalamin biosynthesis protein CobE [Pseudomonas sp. RIT 409]RAU55240.1 cobalamin biosynthesis protein CobE [Pseudomonas sp. RIT 412]